MTRFDRDFLERAFVPRSAPNFADCILRIQGDDSLDPFRRRDLASGLRLLAEAMQSDPATTPADPTWLQPRIAAIAPVMLDLKPKTWANILSNARTALATCGVVEKAIRLNDLSPLWAAVE